MKTAEKEQALRLRFGGYSLSEISRDLGVSKGTASLWVREVTLSRAANDRIKGLSEKGRAKAARSRKAGTRLKLEAYDADARKMFNVLELDVMQKRTLCALIYWCEGGKSDNRVLQFTNSDPDLVRSFLALLRDSYDIDERKLRVCIHLHEYHDDATQRKFWSEVTGIPESQFMKSYLKTHTGIRKKEQYPGCVMIKYYSADITRQVMALGKTFICNYRGVR